MAHDALSPATLARISGETQRVVSFVEAGSGLQWIVFEGRSQPGSDFDSPPFLYFVSEVAIRRVYEFPEEWADLSPAELLHLSWQT